MANEILYRVYRSATQVDDGNQRGDRGYQATPQFSTAGWTEGVWPIYITAQDTTAGLGESLQVFAGNLTVTTASVTGSGSSGPIGIYSRISGTVTASAPTSVMSGSGLNAPSGSLLLAIFTYAPDAIPGYPFNISVSGANLSWSRGWAVYGAGDYAVEFWTAIGAATSTDNFTITATGLSYVHGAFSIVALTGTRTGSVIANLSPDPSGGINGAPDPYSMLSNLTSGSSPGLGNASYYIYNGFDSNTNSMWVNSTASGSMLFWAAQIGNSDATQTSTCSLLPGNTQILQVNQSAGAASRILIIGYQTAPTTGTEQAHIGANLSTQGWDQDTVAGVEIRGS